MPVPFSFSTLKQTFESQKKRLHFYRLAEFLFEFCVIAAVLTSSFIFLFQIAQVFKAALWFFALFVLFFLAALVFGLRFASRYLPIKEIKKLWLQRFDSPQTFEVAELIEVQSPFFKTNSENRSELLSAAAFLEEPDRDDFRKAHLQVWTKNLSEWVWNLRPRSNLLFWFIAAGFFVNIVLNLPKNFRPTLPSAIRAWTPSTFEALLPYRDRGWQPQVGSLSGVSGTYIRFKAPDYGLLQTYLFHRDVNHLDAGWNFQKCQEHCVLQLKERGQYAVGTLFFRSALFPLQVYEDEAPKGVVFANIAGELVPSAVLEVLNIKALPIEMTASDDIELKKIEIHHIDPEAKENLVKTIELTGQHFKQADLLPLEGWKGGTHKVFLRIFDHLRSVDSVPLSISYADEETMREKRLQDLRAVIDEWVHVLADLLESNQQRNFKEGILTRLRNIKYPSTDEKSLVNAFIKELQLLSDRIEGAHAARNISALKDLIERTERQLLYGLSLIFQEKTGDIEATSQSLQSSQKDLNEMLDKIKSGKMELNSKDLEEAFKKLAEKLEELQKKIAQLPQGPQDDLMNREALEAQASESEDLAKKIEEIQKQMAAGDKKGAQRELESLLNQLSILTKEMERNLDQFKQNLDQGAVQKSQEYAKKLDELRKRQEELKDQTQEVKNKSEEIEKRSREEWKPKDEKESDALKKQYEALQKEQQKLGKEFDETVNNFEQALRGTEWQEVFRSEQMKEIEGKVREEMGESSQALEEQRGFDSVSHQSEIIDQLKKLGEGQKKIQNQVQQAQKNPGTTEGRKSEKVEILGSEGKGEKERRRRIMDSLKQKVDEPYQKSHESYFEEQLQR